MVFYCRCFSFHSENKEESEAEAEAEEEDESEYETETQHESSATEYYTAHSEFVQSVPKPHEKSSEISKSSETVSMKPIRSLRVFTLAEIKEATGNFFSALTSGSSEFGSVYGVIKSLKHPFHELQVDVKSYQRFLQGSKEWETEINVHEALEHPNLVNLIGYCGEYKDRIILVNEYMAKGSLRYHLSKPLTDLSWNMRLKVAQDVARGLAYLHEELEVQLVLRDFTPLSVLLDGQWNAKLSDFGFAQLHPPKRPKKRGLGTEIYVAPECVKEGLHTSKSDVWSYGVFLYDLIMGTGPLAMMRNKPKLLKWANLYLGSKRFHQIVDPRLEGNYQLESVQKLCIIANKCLSKNPKSRPKMSEVLEMVNQLIMVPSLATSPTSPQVPQVAVDPIVGPTSQSERTKKPACVPHIRPSKLLTYCAKKGCCVSLQ